MTILQQFPIKENLLVQKSSAIPPIQQEKGSLASSIVQVSYIHLFYYLKPARWEFDRWLPWFVQSMFLGQGLVGMAAMHHQLLYRAMQMFRKVTWQFMLESLTNIVLWFLLLETSFIPRSNAPRSTTTLELLGEPGLQPTSIVMYADV